jgi:helicase MOV-10
MYAMISSITLALWPTHVVSMVRVMILFPVDIMFDTPHFPVAITRAQALLIVIGNPIVLSLDPIWRAFMNYVHINNGWKGKKIDWDPNVVPDADGLGGYDRERREQAVGEADEMVMRLKSLVLDNLDLEMLDVSVEDDSDEDGDGDGARYVEGVWREEE